MPSLLAVIPSSHRGHSGAALWRRWLCSPTSLTAYFALLSAFVQGSLLHVSSVRPRRTTSRQTCDRVVVVNRQGWHRRGTCMVLRRSFSALGAPTGVGATPMPGRSHAPRFRVRSVALDVPPRDARHAVNPPVPCLCADRRALYAAQQG